MRIKAIITHIKPSEEGKGLTAHETALKKWKKLPKAGDFAKLISRKEFEGQVEISKVLSVDQTSY